MFVRASGRRVTCKEITKLETLAGAARQFNNNDNADAKAEAASPAEDEDNDDTQA